MDAFRLENETVLITGGAGGIGIGIAECMLEAGARVILTDIDRQRLESAAETLQAPVSLYDFDVAKYHEASKFVEKVIAEVGEISVLVNNAGNQIIKPAIELTEDEFTTVHNVHVMGSFALSRAVAPLMMKNRKGSILFTSSESAFMGIPKVIAYSASKTAMLGMVRALAAEWSPHGIRVNAIVPGWTETDILKKLFREAPERKEKVLKRTPMGCFGKPEDIGYAAVYLSSTAARFITGTYIIVDGGVSIAL